MTRNRIFAIGCLGAIALVALLVGITWFSVSGAFNLARSRWDEKGSPDYTLIVEQYCFCLDVGSFKITVQSGRVTAVEQITDIGSPIGGRASGTLKPSDFDRMTITAMLSRAQQDQADVWTSPLFRRIDISYDPTYGYVSEYRSDANGLLDELTGMMISDSGYVYKAHDLVITGP